MSKCKVCQSRKGKRLCPGHDGLVCSACCGQERGRGFACPSTCSHLGASQAYQAERSDERRWKQLRERVSIWPTSVQGIERLLFRMERTILQVAHATGTLNDRDIRMVLERWLADLEPARLLLPTEGPPPAPDTPAGRQLQDALSKEMADPGLPTPSAQGLSRAIRRLLKSLVLHHEASDPTGYLRFVRDFLPGLGTRKSFDPDLDIDGWLQEPEDEEEWPDADGDDEEDEDDLSDGNDGDSIARPPFLAEHQAFLEEAYDGRPKPAELTCLKEFRYEIRHDLPVPGMPNRAPPVLEDHPELRDLIEEDPAAARRQIEEWLAQYPGNPVLTHFLIQVARLQNRFDEARRLAEENYRKHPDYLFARCDWAIELMQDDRDDEVPEVVGGGFILPAIFPERKVFHISELAAVCQVASHYYFKQEKPVMAKSYLDLLRQAEPDHPILHNGQAKAVGLAARIKSAFYRLFGGFSWGLGRTGTDGK